MLTLGILDQLPVFEGSTPAQTVRDTVTVATAAEQSGYFRYWVAEHHGDPSAACASPEVLTAAIAASTESMRVGAGCVLLPYTTALRVAESYRLLHALAPTRVELGVGRAAAGRGPTADLLARSVDAAEDYPEQIRRLLVLLGRRPGGGAGPPALAVPEDKAAPHVWVMGSGLGGAATAAALGLPFAFAQFAHPRPQPQVVDHYRAAFRPASPGDVPQVAVAVRVACAEDGRTARALAQCVWMAALAGRAGPTRGWAARHYPALETAAAYVPAPAERELMASGPDLVVTGDPTAVSRRIVELARVYATPEVVLTMACPDAALRARVHELLRDEVRRAVDPSTTTAARPLTAP